MTRLSTVQGAISHVAHHRGNTPALRIGLGVLLVLFFLLALLLQIQTSEAFILQNNVVSFAANWGVLSQPFDLAQGRLSVNLAKAVIWGWGIELVYLVCVIGEVSLQNPRLHGWFRTGAIILVGFNFYTDLNYGTLASGVWGQVAFAAVTSFIVAFFGVIGFNLIWNGITNWGQ